MQDRSLILSQLPTIIRELQAEIRWRPNSAARHLLKRKLRGHLPNVASLEDYHRIIRAVLSTASAMLYLYWHDDDVYPTLVADLNGTLWLVMFSLEGIIETAFVVENPESYLSRSDFEQVGLLSEVLDAKS